jgi:hypothetical protein
MNKRNSNEFHSHFLFDRLWLLSSPQRFLRLRVFHTAVRYGKRHVKLIETSAEERAMAQVTSKFRIMVIWIIYA